MDLLVIILVVLAAIVIIALLLTNIRVVPQAKAFVIERLGAYYCTWPVGLHVKLPIVDRVASIVSLKEDFLDFPPQPVITFCSVSVLAAFKSSFSITICSLIRYPAKLRTSVVSSTSSSKLRFTAKIVTSSFSSL